MPATANSIWKFTKQIDTLLLSARDRPELQRKLNTLQRQGMGGWQLLRVPKWMHGRLIAVLLRPRRD